MEVMEAASHSTDPEEVIDLQDDHLVHRDDAEPEPEPSQDLEEVLTNDIRTRARMGLCSASMPPSACALLCRAAVPCCAAARV